MYSMIVSPVFLTSEAVNSDSWAPRSILICLRNGLAGERSTVWLNSSLWFDRSTACEPASSPVT